MSKSWFAIKDSNYELEIGWWFPYYDAQNAVRTLKSAFDNVESVCLEGTVKKWEP